MNLLNLNDVMTMELSEIDELLSLHKAELKQGYVLNQNNQKEAIDYVNFTSVVETLERAKNLKTAHKAQ
ncbi:hypothetical protein [Alteromonas oceanisediminis]|uniref:hypothetical protein n=1 Tax=Alteromonas oceanisediminis TaxID=2836180 RepID=UPI001BD91C50|nr:hypothetical protein [Alteromonas oceanisediminis]MBT0587959.1 hypothetical protein [Alteromonas oceanisediminis]